MTENDYREAIATAVPRHAASSDSRGEWSEDGALEASRGDYRTRHPQGRRSPNRFFATIHDDRRNMRVGEV